MPPHHLDPTITRDDRLAKASARPAKFKIASIATMKSFIAVILLTLFALSIALPVELEVRAQNQVFSSSQANPDNVNEGIGRGRDTYTFYQGSGANWPKTSQWVSFQQMFDANAEIMKKGCTRWGLPAGYDTTDEEIGSLYWAIRNVAKTTKVDQRFILAVIMQESLGCVRVYTTRGSHANPGLMQSHDGVYSCNPAEKGYNGRLMRPCAYNNIQGMIQEGSGGTVQGDGLAGCLNKAIQEAASRGIANMNGGNAQVFYQAARMYNSGSVNYNNLNDPFDATKCYASDIANRLTGWTSARSGCK